MRKVVIAAALCAASVVAWANDTFEFGVTGSGQVTYQPPAGGTPTLYTGPVQGVAFLTLASGADGTYSNFSADPNLRLVQFDFTRSIGGTAVGIDSTQAYGTFSAQVLGGVVTSLSGTLIESFNNCNSYLALCVTFSGLNFSYAQLGGPTGGTGVYFNATLAPIPEPSTWALMGGGLMLVLHRRFRRGAGCV